MIRVIAKRLQAAMWALGMPTTNEEAQQFADIKRAAMRAGLDEKQAYHLTRLAYFAARGYTDELPKGSFLRFATQERNALEHPRGKDAEDLAAAREGRPSRWGTPEFHRS